ncbi:alpha-ribazole phosphatase [Streptomyces albus]|uniref:Alpha-ribazole phosphatase n=1 Tax=Streptomyces albus (strain ATCC 21838 / DSM 41398 / FERM P-419 / JCM 4703 / NBRC 107858) TaxID=1081613 RepID=A0A0B5EYS7_STRA4|nr:alpha-ribazole phosphatase [Streptomyces albus]AOU77551.1 alpha-ribazole phosphatase [Streptomyces albus]AYN33320.1 histidine phosphatase family protein [Streptomyces albus]
MAVHGSRYLYLARHGEAQSEDGGLTGNGRRQAELLGERLRNVPLTAVHHGPLPRAAQTAALAAARLDGVPLRESEAAGDYVPYMPEAAELPEDSAERLLDFLSATTEEERVEGAALARRALDRFTGPAPGEASVHELVVTHNFLLGWLVREALSAPAWRWLGLNHANAALTVIRYTPGRPTALLVQNDMSHLPAELRWTGLPAEPHHL